MYTVYTYERATHFFARLGAANLQLQHVPSGFRRSIDSLGKRQNLEYLVYCTLSDHMQEEYTPVSWHISTFQVS